MPFVPAAHTPRMFRNFCEGGLRGRVEPTCRISARHWTYLFRGFRNVLLLARSLYIRMQPSLEFQYFAMRCRFTFVLSSSCRQLRHNSVKLSCAWSHCWTRRRRIAPPRSRTSAIRPRWQNTGVCWGFWPSRGAVACTLDVRHVD